MSTSVINNSLFLHFPLEILKDKRLLPTDRILIATIMFLDNENGCYASNDYLASIVGCSSGTISNSICKLCKLGYIISNEENSGRTYIRKARPGLKNHKAVPISKTTLTEFSSLAYKKDILIDKEKRERKKILKDKEDIYQSLQKIYQAKHFIKWDQKANEDLITTFDNINYTFHSQIGLLNSSKKRHITIEIFRIIISNQLPYFKDSNLGTYNKFWNKVIQDKKVKESISKLLSRCPRNSSF